jgi:HSP20 family protein
MNKALMRRPSDMLKSLFDRDLGGFFEPLYHETGPYRDGFLPPIDIFHDEEKISVRVEAPGVKKEDLNVHVEGDLLTISGKKEWTQNENYHQVESRWGEFSRSVTLPHTVDKDNISASYKDGVLLLTLPLTPEAKPKQIEVKID